MATPDPDPLSTGTHTLMAGGLTQRYHVYGSGPVCLAQPGGPGVFWEYLRMPAIEQHLTMVYVEAMGTGASGRHGLPQGKLLERPTDITPPEPADDAAPTTGTEVA